MHKAVMAGGAVAIMAITVAITAITATAAAALASSLRPSSAV